MSARERKQWEARMNVPHRVVPETQKPEAGEDGAGVLDKLIADGQAMHLQAQEEFRQVVGRSNSK